VGELTLESPEICSPHFASLREENTIAIPRHYVKPDYKRLVFRIMQRQQKHDADLTLRQTFFTAGQVSTGDVVSGKSRD